MLFGKFSLGQSLAASRDLNDYVGMYAVMVMIFLIGITVDSLLFGSADRWIRRRYGLIDTAS